MQPVVRFVYFLQLLHGIGMLIRRETSHIWVPTEVSASRKTAIVYLHAIWTTLVGPAMFTVASIIVIVLAVVVLKKIMAIEIQRTSIIEAAKSSGNGSHSGSGDCRCSSRSFLK